MFGDIDFSEWDEALLKQAKELLGKSNQGLVKYEKYADRFAFIADEIEKLRKEIYSGKYLNIDDTNDRIELDDLLFSIQSKLRYDVANILNPYELQKEFQER